MDKILLIDLMNAIWRANITFGGKKPHTPCISCDNIDLHSQSVIHCQCGGQIISEQCQNEAEEYLIVVYNFFRNLRPIVELFSPDKIYLVLEGHPKFRYDLYPNYKANRLIKYAAPDKSTTKVFKAKDIIIELLQYLPVSLIKAANYEADDVIGSLAENLKDEDIVIVTNDSDYLQVLQRGYAQCRIYNPIKKVFLEAPKYNYIAFKSLNGDTSDNIPGLLKTKKAVATVSNPQLFKQFLSTEENRANFSINRQLIEFRNVPMEELEITEGHTDFEILKEAFQQMKFESLMNEKTWTKFIRTFDCLKF